MLNISIFQIDLDKDENAVAFDSLDMLERLHGLKDVDPGIYHQVFAGDVSCENLEDVYRMFNMNKPEGYEGRSLSVSDIVGVADDNGVMRFYYCDCIGFKEVAFDASLAGHLRPAKMRVLLVEPGKYARSVEIGTRLSDLQEAVGGSIEAFYCFSEACCIVCDEDGKYDGSLPNRAVRDEDGDIMDVIFGTFFICDCSGTDFAGLSDEQMEKYRKMFYLPEQILTIDGKIAVFTETNEFA